MDVLIRYGLSIEEIQNMMDCNQDITYTSDSSIKKVIETLKSIGLTDKQVISIIQGNPFVLSKDFFEIEKLFKCLKKLGFGDLIDLFCVNPYLLSLSEDKFNMMFSQKIKDGFSVDEAINYFYYNLVM